MFGPFVPGDGIVIDVGAHAGQFSKLFAKMAPKGRVIAFEPSAYARSVMVPAVRFNRLRNISLVPVGLGDQAAEVVLHTPLKRRRSLGFGTAHIGPAAGATVEQTIHVLTLDQFLVDHPVDRLDLIKMDIEGWELRALKGGDATLRRFHPALYLEVDDRLMGRAGDTPDDLFAYLTQLGYQGFTTPDLRLTPAYRAAGDYLFLPAVKSLNMSDGIDYIAAGATDRENDHGRL